QDLANPEVASLIHVYPEDINGGPISEMWQVPKELPLNFLTPSILVDNKWHYIHEVAQLKDCQWVIPKMWITQAGEIFANCHVVNKNEWVCAVFSVSYHFFLGLAISRVCSLLSVEINNSVGRKTTDCMYL
ncbi:hypothetical protein EV368DRAFT_53693, partial [Lentinula lateritia]